MPTTIRSLPARYPPDGHYRNQWHQDCFGMGECHLENKIFTMDRRVMGFWDTGREPFAFAFLVRDGIEQAPGEEENPENPVNE